MNEMPKILIVDDQPQNLFALVLLLGRTESTVIPARSGEEALALTLQHQFALAIVDVQMPGMDGYELVDLMQSNPSTAKMPVIFVTAAYSDEQHQHRAYESGGVDYLVKPFDPDLLLGKVRVFLELANYRRNLESIIETRTQTIRETTAFQKNLLAISNHLLNLPLTADFEAEVTQMLLQAAVPMGASRVFVVRCAEARQGIEQVVEWRADSGLPLREAVRGAGGSYPVWSAEHLAESKVVAFRSIDDLPCDAHLERRILKAAGLGSCVLAAMRSCGDFQGIIGVAGGKREKPWPDTVHAFLPMLANTLAGAWNRHRAVNALRASEERYRELVEHANSIILRMTLSGEIVFFNEYAQRFFNYSEEEILGRNIVGTLEASGEESTASLRAMLRRLALRQTQQEMDELQHDLRGGGKVWVSWTVKRLADENEHTGQVLCVGIDATARKQAEEEKLTLEAQFQQAQKMESVGRLAGGVAHDFNNMLGVVLGRAQMGMARLQPGDPLRAYLEDIYKAGERSALLTRQLLTFARKQHVMPRTVDLNEIVSGMLKLLERLVGEDIKFEWQPGRGVWPVFVDPTQVEQILANLVVNARDAIADVGTITILTGNLVVRKGESAQFYSAPPGEYVWLRISDTGCGMPPEVLDRIFEPFFTTKEVGRGTGLGLATVYGAIKQNQGLVDVQSRVGCGSAFTMLFPRGKHKTAPEPEDTESHENPRGSAVVLLVEDDHFVLTSTATVLESLGYTVLAAHNAKEALNIARKEGDRIDLIITDVIMPDCNGGELTRQLAEYCPGVHCIYVSGYPSDVIAKHGVLDPDADFVHKPCSVTMWAEKIRDVLNRRPVKPSRAGDSLRDALSEAEPAAKTAGEPDELDIPEPTPGRKSLHVSTFGVN